MTSKTTPSAVAGRRLRKGPARIASVPSKAKYLDGYQRRVVSGFNDEFTVYDFAIMNQTNVLIEGPTGAGKTTSILAWAALRNLHAYTVSSSIGLEPSMLFGKYIPDGDSPTGVAWQDGPVTDIVRHGGVLVLNEVNFIPERVGTVLFSLLDGRREIQLQEHKGEVITAHDDCVIFADMNPDYQGTRALNWAFRNRFPIQLVFDYDTAVEEKLVACDQLRKLAALFRDRHTQGDYETPFSTNMLMEFERHYKFLGYDFARMVLLSHFTIEERQSAKQVIDTMATELMAELSKKIKRRTPYDDDFYDVDKGEYGKDWFYGDELAAEDSEEWEDDE